MNTTRLLLTTTTALIAILSIILSQTNTLQHLLSPLHIHGSNDDLHRCNILQLHGAFGPESLAFDSDGVGPYTGVADGRILKWRGDDLGWTDFAVTSTNRTECVRPFNPGMEHICGRPLGLRFHKKTGQLYIADAYLGFLVVGPEGGLATPIVTHVEGQPLRFTNDLDIDEHDDVIYFSDSSTVFQRRQFMASILSGDKTGRLLRYNIATKEVKVLVRDIAFANGVALSKDRSFVLVAETTTDRILRYWLLGPETGKVDVFAEVPGYPDNIRRNSNGEFWVALHSKTTLFGRVIRSNPWVGKALLKLPLTFQQLHYVLTGGKAHATAIKFSEQGEVLQILEDSEGKILRFISEVEEKDGKLWMGSVLTPLIGMYNV